MESKGGDCPNKLTLLRPAVLSGRAASIHLQNVREANESHSHKFVGCALTGKPEEFPVCRVDVYVEMRVFQFDRGEPVFLANKM